MKAGDLVKLVEFDYPQYKGKFGVLVELRGPGDRWIVMIDGRLHPYVVDGADMVVA